MTPEQVRRPTRFTPPYAGYLSAMVEQPQTLHAIGLVCSLKPSPAASSSTLIAEHVAAELRKHGVESDLVVGMVFAPRFTRLTTSIFTVLAGADFLQLGYAMAQRWAEGPQDSEH